jgi:hypothetical protein
LLLIFIAIQTDYVQNRIIQIAVKKISAELGTQVSIKNVSFSLFNSMNLQGVFLKDKKQDTLIYAGQVKLRITDWFFFKDQAIIKYVGLEDAVIKLNRTDSVWNYQFIANYFAGAPKKNKKPSGLE